MTSPIPNPLDKPAARWSIAYAYAAGRWDQRHRTELGDRGDLVHTDQFADVAQRLGITLPDFADLYDQLAGINLQQHHDERKAA